MARRPLVGVLLAVGLGLGVAIGAVVSGLPASKPAAGGVPRASAGASSSLPATAGSPTASPSPGTPSVSPGPSASPGPVLVAAPLDGLLVSPAAAAQHPIACMIDDLSAARPQSGFSDASVVWQAPAEGGIPRYMLVFQERTPKSVGPVRSARYYYIAWAAEWRAVYCHAGGSPQALQTLRAQGHGQLVYNADQFFNGPYFWRITTRFAPHNLYTDGKHLHALAGSLGATAPPGRAVWRFAADALLSQRPVGGQIDVAYLANHVTYKYDRATNTSGPAWIATNGKTVKGTWRKKSLTAPTLFYDASGRPVTLTAGQTFVQVMKTTDLVLITAGKPAPVSVMRGPRRD